MTLTAVPAAPSKHDPMQALRDYLDKVVTAVIRALKLNPDNLYALAGNDYLLTDLLPVEHGRPRYPLLRFVAKMDGETRAMLAELALHYQAQGPSYTPKVKDMLAALGISISEQFNPNQRIAAQINLLWLVMERIPRPRAVIFAAETVAAEAHLGLLSDDEVSAALRGREKEIEEMRV
jgi:hypothetical protein